MHWSQQPYELVNYYIIHTGGRTIRYINKANVILATHNFDMNNTEYWVEVSLHPVSPPEMPNKTKRRVFR